MAPHRVSAVGEQTSLADRKRRAGQRLFLGFEGLAVDQDTRKLIAEIRPAGFILFARNIEDPRQVLELNRELSSLCEPAFPPLLSIDQEGGRVQRIRQPATCWPPMRAVGCAENQTYDVSRAIALELKAMGFHLNFAPVADVDSNPDNPVIGDRSFSPSPDAVCKHVAAFIAGHQEAHIMACAKHFPGHGDTALDSHLDLPVVDRSTPELLRTEMPPFKAAIQAGVASIMTAHVIFAAWDEQWPATLSEKIIRPRLREQLGFDGLVFSDDLEMKAVAGRYPLALQLERATKASVDILLCCKSPDLQWLAYTELIRLQENSPAAEKASVKSNKRLEAARLQYCLPHKKPALDVVGCAEHLALAELVRQQGTG